jgi:hypothetical protein
MSTEIESSLNRLHQEYESSLVKYLLDIVKPIMGKFPEFDLRKAELTISGSYPNWDPDVPLPYDTISIWYKHRKKEIWFDCPMITSSACHTYRGFLIRMDCDLLDEDGEERESTSFYFEDEELDSGDGCVSSATEIITRFVAGVDLGDLDWPTDDEDPVEDVRPQKRPMSDHQEIVEADKAWLRKRA